MDEPNRIPQAKSAQGGTTPPTEQPTVARGSGHISETPRERTEHSVMEGLPDWKAERFASMRRELADLQRQVIDAQQRIATELQGRADDAERFDAIETRLQAQELKSEEDAKRAAELETTIAGLRSQLASATATTEELRRDIAARDTQIAEVRAQHADVTKQLEAQAASLRETKTQLETRDGELATRTTERDAEQATKAGLERELEEERKQHREITEQLEIQIASTRDAKAVIATRDGELAAMTAERDALKGELEQARTALEAGRAKAREVATHLARFGQDLVEGGIGVVESGPSPEPKAVPPTAKQIEPVVDLTEQPRPAPSRMRSVLLVLVGLILGGAATFAIVKGINASSAAGGDGQDLGASPSVPLAAPVAAETPPEPAKPVEAIVDPSMPSAHPASDTAANAAPKQESPPAEEIVIDGVIVLPESAARRRVFVDGKVVEVKRSRAVVPCGSRKVRIGSTGTERKVEVACGGETAMIDDKANR